VLTRLGLGALWLLHWLPLRALAFLGRGLGNLLFPLARERRRVCLTNLERCFPHLPRDERFRLARRHFQVFARSVLERGLLWWAPRERIVRLVRGIGMEHVIAAQHAPLILLAPHFVGLDAGWTRLTCELDMSGIYANQKDAVVNAVLLAGRTRFGRQRALARQQGVRAGLAAIKEHLPFYYLPDMDYGPRDSIFVPFFGVPAATVTGLARLARLGRARVVPCVTRMLPGGAGYEVRCFAAWDDFPGDDPVADTRRMNAFIEERVREMPEQYFWTHKRFKTRPPGEPRWY
jgi:Kdo2-lipid IVA lauroyltransferase/acyltransferase